MSERNIIDTTINNILQDRSLQGNSQKWANWVSQLTLLTCLYCAQQHGKIVDISVLENKIEVMAHEHTGGCFFQRGDISLGIGEPCGQPGCRLLQG